MRTGGTVNKTDAARFFQLSDQNSIPAQSFLSMLDYLN